MLTKIRIMGLVICTSGLSACVTDDSMTYSSYVDRPTLVYDESYQSYPSMSAYNAPASAPKDIATPESYYANSAHAPSLHKDMDKSWVSQQNAQAYTIELTHSEKASEVAGTLSKAPKSERTAEIKYQQGDKSYYKGLYGSYPNYEAAQQALKSLPDNMKQGASVTPWSSIQSQVTE